MAREGLVRALLAALALSILAAGVEAQKGRGGRKAKGGAPGVGAPAKPGAQKSELPPLTLPGLTPPGEAKKGEGKKQDPFEALFGPKGTEGPKADPKEAPKAAPPKPPAPLEPADEVTAAADHLARQAEVDARRVREHFGVCDLDQNGWLSLREAEVTLSLSRDEYRRSDANQDGRLEPAEFEAQQSLLLTRMGVPSAEPAPQEPAPATEPPADPGPTPQALEPESGSIPTHPQKAPSQFDSLLVHPVDLLRRYDVDNSKGIGVSEVEKLLNEIGLALSAEMVVAQMDPNDSGELGARELTPLAWLTSKHLPESLRPELLPSPAAPEASDEAVPVPPAPTLTTHFARLDSDHDGSIGESDLRALQGNVRIEVRLRAVLSAMDADGDGRLTEAEFASSMRRGPR